MLWRKCVAVLFVAGEGSVLPALPCLPSFLAFLFAVALAVLDTPTCNNVQALLLIFTASQHIPKMVLLWRLRPADLWSLRIHERRDSVEYNGG